MAQCDLFLESSGCPYPSIPIPPTACSRERAVGHGVLQPGTPEHIHSGFSGTGPDGGGEDEGGLGWTRTRIARTHPSWLRSEGPQASPRLAGCATTRELFTLEQQQHDHDWLTDLCPQQQFSDNGDPPPQRQLLGTKEPSWPRSSRVSC